MQAGFRDINDLSGIWLGGGFEAPAVTGGFIGILHLSGVWIWGAAPPEPPEPGEGGIGKLRFQNAGKLGIRP